MTHHSVPGLTSEPSSAAPPAGNGSSRPNLSGDIEELLERPPVFRTAIRGYDRLQVDNYLTWAESELRAGRKEIGDLAARLGRSEAEREMSRQLLAGSPHGQEMTQLSERIGTMLRLAADEAAELSASGRADAERVLRDARAEAEARLSKAAEIKQRAVEQSHRLREEAENMRAAASATLAAAQQEVDRLKRDASRERARLDQEAAQAREQEAAALARRLAATRAAARREQEDEAAAAAAELARVRDAVAELNGRRERARESLLRLNDQIEQALQVVIGLGEVVRADDLRQGARRPDGGTPVAAQPGPR